MNEYIFKHKYEKALIVINASTIEKAKDILRVIVVNTEYWKRS